MSKSIRPPLTLPQYERIFRIIHGVLLNEECDPSKSCTYFALIGAFLLEHHHRLNANPRAGAATYNFGLPGNDVLAFGKKLNGKLASDDEAFHFWVEVNDWVIDFQAPIFQSAQIQPKMFQKVKNPSAQPHTPGSFLHETNPQLTNLLIQQFQRHPMNADLVGICTNWYRPPPKSIKPSIPISNGHGKISEVKLSPITLTGVW